MIKTSDRFLTSHFKLRNNKITKKKKIYTYKKKLIVNCN
jgi:hypothetical protein